MSARVEKLDAPAFSPFALAVLGSLSTTTAALVRGWAKASSAYDLARIGPARFTLQFL